MTYRAPWLLYPCFVARERPKDRGLFASGARQRPELASIAFTRATMLKPSAILEYTAAQRLQRVLRKRQHQQYLHSPKGQASCDAPRDIQQVLDSDASRVCMSHIALQGLHIRTLKELCRPSEGHIQSRAHIRTLSEPVKLIPELSSASAHNSLLS